MATTGLKKKYENLLLKLFPNGMAWNKGNNSNLRKLSKAFSEELARLDDRARQVIEEADPRTTYETLVQWERLVDFVPNDEMTLDERRTAVLQKLTTGGGASVPFFQEIARQLGFPEITITSLLPFTTESTVDERIYGEEVLHWWTVTAPATLIKYLTCDSTVDEPLDKVANTLLEDVILRLKPAHTRVIFSYEGE